MSLFGAVIGFLLFNRSPALTFMGDSGSQFLGYMTALLSIWATESADGKQSMLPLLILAIPLLDVFFAFTRRLLKGVPFYSADRDHIHHRLLAKGFSSSIYIIDIKLSVAVWAYKLLNDDIEVSILSNPASNALRFVASAKPVVECVCK